MGWSRGVQLHAQPRSTCLVSKRGRSGVVPLICSLTDLYYLPQEVFHNRTVDEARSNYPVVGDSRPHWQLPLRAGFSLREQSREHPQTREARRPGQPSTKEDVVNKVWLYAGGIIVATAVLIYTVPTVVSNTHPLARDLRAAYETTK